MGWLWLLLVTLPPPSQPVVRVPPKCIRDLAQYWKTAFTWEGAYAQFQHLQQGAVVDIGSCRISMLEDDSVAIHVPSTLLQVVDRWYLALHRPETVALVTQFLTGVCVDIPINRQEQIVSVCPE